VSLRLRLTLITTVVLAVVLGVFGSGVYVLLDRNLRSRLDQTLEQRTLAVARLMRLNPEVASLGFLPPNFYVEIVGTDGTILDKSPALGNEQLPVDPGVATVAAGRRDAFTYETSVGPYHLRVRAVGLIDRASGTPVGSVLVAASVQEADETLARLRGILILAGIAGIALAAALGWRSARTALKPVEEIGATAQEIGATGDLSRRVSSDRTDELGQLTRAFNTMLDRLQAAQAALSRTVETQRRFVDDASHELRTPLTIMRGNLELVAREPSMAPAERDAALRDSIAEAERMTQLVDDLLALARVDAGMTMPDLHVALAPLVRAVAQETKATAGDRTISVTIGSESAGVRGSENLLRRVLANLADNAVKHTRPDGAISLSLVQENDAAILTVADDGVGMTAEEVPHVFDRFWRSDASRERPGSGLGLAIAKAVVEAHGGTIEAASEPGAGTTFTVRLPLFPVATPFSPPPVPATI
jgi:two-component system, OmpR family, sensor kinase